MTSLRLRRLHPRRLPVPLVVGLVVVVIGLVLPLTATGTMPLTRAYGFAGLFLVVSVLFSFPYALFVTLGTLPLLWVGGTGYASPTSSRQEGAETPTPSLVGRHVVAGVFYSLASAFVGVLCFAVTFALPSLSGSGLPDPPTPGLTGTFPVPWPMLLGGVLVAGVFLACTLARSRTVGSNRRQRLVSTALAVVVALAPAATFAAFATRAGM